MWIGDRCDFFMLLKVLVWLGFWVWLLVLWILWFSLKWLYLFMCLFNFFCSICFCCLLVIWLINGWVVDFNVILFLGVFIGCCLSNVLKKKCDNGVVLVIRDLNVFLLILCIMVFGFLLLGRNRNFKCMLFFKVGRVFFIVC